jgi:hypothetical protein
MENIGINNHGLHEYHNPHPPIIPHHGPGVENIFPTPPIIITVNPPKIMKSPLNNEVINALVGFSSLDVPPPSYRKNIDF